jgi:hypothetical protein
MFKKIRYPLQDDQRAVLENLCASWLKPFGLADGEWWYNTFTPEIIIERQVGLGDTSITWNVYTFGEKVGFVSGYRKLAPISSPLDETTWVDEDFNPLPFQNPNKKRLTEIGISRQTQERMISFAKAIGRQFKFVRVDFLVDHEENVFLGEMTFNPMNGLNTSRPRDFDVWLGDLWDQTSY